MQYPIITVVIPLYNGAQHIRRSVESVLRQSYTDFELLVVDDGSTDGGSDIVLEFTDSRIRLVRQDNAGASAARNRGIAEGRSDYIAFLDDDDELEDQFLDAIMDLSMKYPQAGIYSTGHRLLFRRGSGVEVTVAEARHHETSLLVTDYFYRTNSGNLVHASGVMVPRPIFEEVGVFKVGERYEEDLEMWARIALRYPIGYDTRILYSCYKTGIHGKSRFQRMQRYSPKVKMLQQVLAESPDSLVNREIIRSHIKKYLISKCIFFITNFNRKAAVVFMENSNASIWAPLMNRLINIRLLWPFVKVFAWIYRGSRCRIAMKMCGGKRVSCGVRFKLIDRS